ncbi:MAG: enoyl-CoA hydratase [Rhizobiaceae bacterium]
MSLKVSKHNRVATITISRPEARNAMTRSMWSELVDLLRSLETDKAVGCIVITGTGGAFCSGGDVKGMLDRLNGKGNASLEEETAFVRSIMEASRLLHEMPKPTIAAINGACAGAGFALALACDMRLADEDAKFTTAFANVAGSGDFGGSWFLTKIVGTAKARELYYFAPIFSGRLAEDMGVVNKAYDADDLMDATVDWAERLANGPSVALGYMKKNMNLAEQGTLSQALDQEALHMMLSFRTEDHREAATAFVEKRDPKFTGR